MVARIVVAASLDEVAWIGTVIRSPAGPALSGNRYTYSCTRIAEDENRVSRRILRFGRSDCCLTHLVWNRISRVAGLIAANRQKYVWLSAVLRSVVVRHRVVGDDAAFAARPDPTLRDVVVHGINDAERIVIDLKLPCAATRRQCGRIIGLRAVEHNRGTLHLVVADYWPGTVIPVQPHRTVLHRVRFKIDVRGAVRVGGPERGRERPFVALARMQTHRINDVAGAAAVESVVVYHSAVRVKENLEIAAHCEVIVVHPVRVLAHFPVHVQMGIAASEAKSAHASQLRGVLVHRHLSRCDDRARGRTARSDERDTAEGYASRPANRARAYRDRASG